MAVHLEKFSLHFFKFVVCNYPCESSPCQPRSGPGPRNEVVSMFVLLWCIIISLVFFYFSLLLFTGFLQLQGYVVSVQKNSKYRDCASKMIFMKIWIQDFFLTSRKLPEFSAMQYRTNKSARDFSTLRKLEVTPDSFCIDSSTHNTIK